MIVKIYDVTSKGPDTPIWTGELQELLHTYQESLEAEDVAVLKWLRAGESVTVSTGFRVERAR